MQKIYAVRLKVIAADGRAVQDMMGAEASAELSIEGDASAFDDPVGHTFRVAAHGTIPGRGRDMAFDPLSWLYVDSHFELKSRSMSGSGSLSGTVSDDWSSIENMTLTIEGAGLTRLLIKCLRLTGRAELTEPKEA